MPLLTTLNIFRKIDFDEIDEIFE
jgi:hypothetical protein